MSLQFRAKILLYVVLLHNYPTHGPRKFSLLQDYLNEELCFVQRN